MERWYNTLRNALRLFPIPSGYLRKERDKDKLSKKIIECQLTFPKYVNEECRKLLVGLLNPEPSKRLSIATIREDPYFNSIRKSSKEPEVDEMKVVRHLIKQGVDAAELQDDIQNERMTALSLKFNLFCNKERRGELTEKKKDRASLVSGGFSRTSKAFIKLNLHSNLTFGAEQLSNVKEEFEVKKQTFSCKFKELASSLRGINRGSQADFGTRYSTKVRALYKTNKVNCKTLKTPDMSNNYEEVYSARLTDSTVGLVQDEGKKEKQKNNFEQLKTGNKRKSLKENAGEKKSIGAQKVAPLKVKPKRKEKIL